MKIPIIPKNLIFGKITELSPSKYTQLKNGCVYSFLMDTTLRKCGRPKLHMPPKTFNNVIGTIIHKVYQYVNTGSLERDEEKITQFWQNECKKHTENISAEYPSLRNIMIADYDAMFDTIDVVCNASNNVKFSTTNDTKIQKPNEHEVELKGLLRGSIDKVKANSNGYEIIDYKTGKYQDENGNIKQDYIDQLNLYAYMLEECEGVTVNKLTILDIKGNEIDVPYYKSEKRNVLNAVKALIDKINDSIDKKCTDTLINSSQDNCNFCTCYHLCNKRCDLPESSFHIIEGTVTKVWNQDQISIRTHTGDEVIVSKLRVLNIEDIDTLIGKTLIFVNLIEVQSNSLYSRCDWTTIYEREV